MDRTARFDRIYDAHRRAVYALFFASTHCLEASEDGVQETFLRIWRRLEAVPILGERSYVLRVARTASIDAARRTAAKPKPAPESEAATPGVGPFETTATNLDLDRLDAAIRALPDDLRRPLVMAVVGDMNSADIGEVLDKNPGTIRYLIHQARVRLKESMR